MARLDGKRRAGHSGTWMGERLGPMEQSKRKYRTGIAKRPRLPDRSRKQ